MKQALLRFAPLLAAAAIAIYFGYWIAMSFESIEKSAQRKHNRRANFANYS